MKTLPQRLALGIKLGLSKGQTRILARLRSPAEVQDFITAIPANFEPGGDTCTSVAETLRRRRAHCVEGAYVAACALWMMGYPPLVMDLQAKGDYDHVVALFRRAGHWGAISKSNHLWLRWRDPVYRSLRELAMSYFHEYSSGGRKTMSAYSAPIDLRRFDPDLWITGCESCWDVTAALDAARHYPLIRKGQTPHLRAPDALQRQADKLLDYKPPRKIRVRRRRKA